MKRTEQKIHMTTAQREWLRAESDRTGLALAEIVRRAIDEYSTRRDTRRRSERAVNDTAETKEMQG